MAATTTKKNISEPVKMTPTQMKKKIEYLEAELEKIKNSAWCYMCDKHNKEKILYLCKNCKTNLCEKCLTKHNTDFKDHLLYTKENDIITGKVDEIIKQCKNLIKYNELLKNKITNLLAGNNERIKQIEEQYNKNLKINEEIVHFIEIMLQNYKELPYILYNHFHFFHLLQIQIVESQCLLPFPSYVTYHPFLFNSLRVMKFCIFGEDYQVD